MVRPEGNSLFRKVYRYLESVFHENIVRNNGQRKEVVNNIMFALLLLKGRRLSNKQKQLLRSWERRAVRNVLTSQALAQANTKFQVFQKYNSGDFLDYFLGNIEQALKNPEEKKQIIDECFLPFLAFFDWITDSDEIQDRKLVARIERINADLNAMAVMS